MIEAKRTLDFSSGASSVFIFLDSPDQAMSIVDFSNSK